MKTIKHISLWAVVATCMVAVFDPGKRTSRFEYLF